MIRVIIADDEALAASHLAELLKKHTDIQIIQTVSDGADAIAAVKNLQPDAVFLDIEMPKMNGLEAASRIAELDKPPVVIFATAFNQYAIEAFEANAVDYLLKPIDMARLEKTLARVKERVKSEHPVKEQLESLDDDLIQRGLVRRIVAHRRQAKDRIVIDPNEVFYFYVHNTEVWTRLKNEELIVNSTLKELLQNLDSNVYLQTHKSYIVNIQKIEKVAPMFSGNFEIAFRDIPNKVPLSRRYARQLKSKLKNW